MSRDALSSFIDNIWGDDLADMQLVSKFNKGICFLQCVIDIVSDYTWVILLKDKKRITTTNAFQNVLGESNRKPNKIWEDKGSEFYNRSIKSWLEKILYKFIQRIYIQQFVNEGKSIIAERFIETLKNKIYRQKGSPTSFSSLTSKKSRT